MTDLRIAVERIVRPIRASHANKLKMREELLGHLVAVFDEERARLGDDEAAVRRAVARLGDPAALRRELQQSVPWLDRLSMEVDPGKSVLWNTWRMYRVMIPVQFCLMFLALGTTAAFDSQFHRSPEWLFRTMVILVALGLVEFPGMWGLIRTWGDLFGLFGVRKSIRRAAWFLGAQVAILAVFGVVLLAYASLRISPLNPVAWLTSPGVGVVALYLAVPGALLLGVISVATGMREGPRLRRVQAWHLLEVD